MFDKKPLNCSHSIIKDRGVATEIDLLKQIREGMDLEKLTADEIMTKNPITVDISASLDEILNIMIEKT